MREYTVRSTRTKTESAARRAADIAVVLLLCAALVVFIFKVLLIPFGVIEPGVFELSQGDTVLVDRVSRYVSDYSLGDIVRAETSGGEGFYRVAALGGSTYLVRNGKAYLNGAFVDESGYSSGWPEGRDMFISVPDEGILLLPDDRTGIGSLEGWSIPYNSVYGEVRMRISPIRKLAIFY